MKKTAIAATALMAVLAGQQAEAVDFEPIEAEEGSTLELGLRLSGLAGATFESVGPFEVRDDGTTFETGPRLHEQLRLGLDADMTLKLALPILVHAEFEEDLFTGHLLGEPNLEGVDLPDTDAPTSTLRKLNGRLSLGPLLHIGGGVMTSHWGLGLLANDGAHTWTPGSARFVDPRGGDIVLRAFVGTGPFTDASISVLAFADEARQDDALRPGDEATQFGGAIRFGTPSSFNGGIYAVRRLQTAQDGDELEVTAFDLTFSAPLSLGERASLTLEGELAFITGSTSLAPSFDHPEHDVQQLGAAARATLDLGGYGAVLDVLLASGDRNLDDGEQNAFKADANYEMGLLLFRHVLAAQTGHAPITASNPDLVGVPAEDLDRFPTGGGATNTIAIFPRGYWQPTEALEIYGGALLAFSEVELVDPLNTRLAGGAPRNALGGDPGGYLGTELDFGARGRVSLWEIDLTLGLEAGVLIPGAALEKAAGQTHGTVFGSRALIAMEL